MANVTKLVAAAFLLIAIGAMPAKADQTQFQRIRNFDPVRGLAPSPDSLTSPKDSKSKSRYVPARDAERASAETTSDSQQPSPGTMPIDSPGPLDDDNQQDMQNGGSNSNSSTIRTQTLPPNTLSRPPIPPVNNNLSLPQLNNVSIKTNLSWRSKAYKLSQESTDTQNAKHPTCLLNGSVQESLNAISQACQSHGLQILGQSVPAGQLAARLADATSGKFLFLFVAKKKGDDRTLVKASVEPDSKGQKLATLNDLLIQAASLVDGKGLL